MFSSPTAWNDLYGQQSSAPPQGPTIPTGSYLNYNSTVPSNNATFGNDARSTGNWAPPHGMPPGTAAVKNAEGDFRRGAEVSAVRPQQPTPRGALFASATHYTVASQPVRCFPPPPTSQPSFVPFRGAAPTPQPYLQSSDGPYPQSLNRTTEESSTFPAVYPTDACSPRRWDNTPTFASTCWPPAQAGALNNHANVERLDEQYRSPYARAAADTSLNGQDGGFPPRPPPRDTTAAAAVDDARFSPPFPEPARFTAFARAPDYPHYFANNTTGVGAGNGGEDRTGVTTRLPPCTPPPPLQQHQDHHRHHHSSIRQGEEGPHHPLSISDGACHLNAVRHRSAASAFLFYNSSGPSSASGRHSVPYRCVDAGDAYSPSDLLRGNYGSNSMPGSPRTPYKRDRRGDARYGGSTPHGLSPLSSATSTCSMATSASAAAVTTTEPCCVAAVIFNNAKEVGVALCELPSLTISLLQFADTAVFFKSSSLLHSRNPVEVLVPSTVVETEFVEAMLRQHGAHMTFTSVQRCFYNAEAGVQRLRQLKSSEEAALCIEDTDRYLCVAAANALVLYMEHVNDMQLLPGSIRVRAEALEHFMEVSRTTARALQIVADGVGDGGRRRSDGVVGVLSSTPATAGDGQLGESRTPFPSSSFSSPQRQRPPRSSSLAAPRTSGPAGYGAGAPTTLVEAYALVDVIPRACTVMGQRYLRRTLLQPLRDRVAVQGRHDSVEWLVRDPRRLHMLRALLRQTAALDLERLTATLTLQPRGERLDGQKEAYLESLLLLWSALPYLERLHTQLAAYLGPPPETEDDRDTAMREASHSTHDEQSENQEEEVKKSADKVARVPLVSSPAYPSVLHSVAATLRQCRFTELAALMGRYLEQSVLPSVVEHHTQQTTTTALSGGSTFPAPSVRLSKRSVGPDACPGHDVAGQSALRAQNTAGSSRGPQQPQQNKRNATTTLLRVLRMCFLVQAPRGGELDALRTRLSQRIVGITTYAEQVKQHFQLYSLRLEPDPAKLYCFSYLAGEEAKARAVPFTWRYAGGSHFALYLAALKEQQQQQENFSRGGGGDGFIRGGRGRDTPRRLSTDTSAVAFSSSSFSSPLVNSRTSRRPSAPMRQPDFAAAEPPPLAPSYATMATPAEACHPSFLSPSMDSSSSNQQQQQQQQGQQQRRRPKRRVRCGTEELEYRCARTQECVAAILDQQMQLVEPLVQNIRKAFLGALQATVESVALLDTLLSFALYSVTHHCTRPVLVERKTGLTTAPEKRMDVHVEEAEMNSSGASSPSCSSNALGDAASVSTMFTDARDNGDDESDDAETCNASRIPFFMQSAFHPSAGAASLSTPRAHAGLFPAAPAAPASVSDVSFSRGLAGRNSNGGLSFSWGEKGAVCIITGPNSCGKTTLLRVVGQHITLAQAGCFVPAQHTQLFLSDRVFAHMLCDELPSVTHSSFKRELMELNELAHAATADSVVLIDELGRSTTTAQGFSLAWATALFLSHRHVHAVLTTHFAGLPSLTRVRPGRVVAFHFRVSLAQVDAGTAFHLQQRIREHRCEGNERRRRAAGDVDEVHAIRSNRADPPCTQPRFAVPRVTIARFGHELFPGPCVQRWYGLAMAEGMHFFEPVLAWARRARECRERDLFEDAEAAD